MSADMRAIPLGWTVHGNVKWGFEVVIFDAVDDYQIILVTEDDKATGFSSAIEARAAAATALRELADRIERGET